MPPRGGGSAKRRHDDNRLLLAQAKAAVGIAHLKQAVSEAAAARGEQGTAPELLAPLLQLGGAGELELLRAVTEWLEGEGKLKKRPPQDAGVAEGEGRPRKQAVSLRGVAGGSAERSAKQCTAASASGESRSSSGGGGERVSAAKPRSRGSTLDGDNRQKGGRRVGGMVGGLLSLENRLRARETQVCTGYALDVTADGMCRGRGARDGACARLPHFAARRSQLHAAVEQNVLVLIPSESGRVTRAVGQGPGPAVQITRATDGHALERVARASTGTRAPLSSPLLHPTRTCT